MQRATLLLLLCITLSWHDVGAEANNAEPEPELLNKDHPLVDRIWNVQAKKFVTQAELISQLADYEYILLGETHDNRRHHAIQAQLIDSLSQAGQQATVAFEMINDEQGEVLDAQEYSSVARLIELLRGIEDKWPYTRDYKIVFESVLHAGYPIRPANLRQETIRRIAREGESGIPGKIGQHLEQVVLTAHQQQAMQADIVAGHCDMLPATAVQPMVKVQRVRDAVMSMSLLESTTPVKVLIAGAGHVRKDHGVPVYLRTVRQDARILALGMLEVDASLAQASAYTERWGGEHLPFDLVWFTPRAERSDPCLGLREKMHKARTE